MQENPDGYIDLWARDHYKSTIITYAKTIQDILISEGKVTCSIFSHTRPIAKKFLAQIMYELETNRTLKTLFPDILYDNPKKDAPRWSLDSGIIVKRDINPAAATVEAWGLVDGQPTGSHFDLLIYDDVVTLSSVNTPDMIQKTTDALKLSYNLGSQTGHVRRFIGTRYHFNDTYREVIDRGTAKPRLYSATENGEFTGKPVLLTKEVLEEKIRDMGSYVAACQLFQNPKADGSQGFKREHLMYYDEHHDGANLNVYILVDPANDKKKKSDYTAIAVIGLGADRNFMLLDMYRDKLSLKERTKLLIDLHAKWRPKGVGYEKYGKDADIDHIEFVQQSMNYRFDITELGGKLSKNDRIRKLLPVFEAHQFYMPRSLMKTLHDHRTVDLVEVFINEEYLAFPVPVHDDCLDCISRILDPDLGTVWPRLKPSQKDAYTEDKYISNRGTTWMSA